MFANEAKKYWSAGLSPLPIIKQQKRPVILDWSRYCAAPASEAMVDRWIADFPEFNIGLALGKINDRLQLQFAAVDIDDEELVDDVVAAIGTVKSAKKGKKGLTVFVMADPQMRNSKLKRRGTDGKPLAKPSVELLCDGSQTVIPPSIHPDTNKPYEWIGAPLLSLRGTDLPILTKTAFDEIMALCHGKGEPFQDLNKMTWLGEGNGGDTHDICVRAVACMVSRGWDDADILTRIERAKRSACERHGDEYNWPGATKAIQEWIDSARSKGMTGSSAKGKKVPPERMMADFALELLGGPDRVATRDGIIRQYREGYWPSVNVTELMREMYKAEPTLRVGDAKNAVVVLETMTDNPSFGKTPGVVAKHDPKRQRLCLTNGTMNLITGELGTHDPDDQCMHKLDFAWDDDAECPLYLKVLNMTFDSDPTSIALWNEYCGLSLVDDMSFQKILFLRGPGGNGKGTLSRVLKSVHNPDSIGSVGVTDLDNERKRTSLVGKLINISGEQSRLNLMSDAYLKKITGEDPIDVRRLYSETQNNVYLSVRFLELVNEMPMTSDTSEALKRRIMILNCPNKIVNPDTDLDKKLYAERSGILRVWLKALKNLYERGKFDEPKSSKSAVEEYLAENDPVRSWIDQRTIKLDMTDPKAKPLPGFELYSDYREWATQNGYRNPLPEVMFSRRLNTLGYDTVVIRYPGRGPLRVRPMRLMTPADY